MKRTLTPEQVKAIEHCINRGNSAIIRVEHKGIVVLEMSKRLVFREEEKKQTNGSTE